jgi:hypothetical protein
MKYSKVSIASTTAVETVNLRTQLVSTRVASDVLSQDVELMGDFDVEVVGNDASVTMTAKGSFPTSDFVEVSDGVFAIGGGKKSMSGFSIAELKFTRTGTTEYDINILRRIEE